MINGCNANALADVRDVVEDSVHGVAYIANGSSNNANESGLNTNGSGCTDNELGDKANVGSHLGT